MEPSLTTFVGREDDVARVAELLRDPRVRLLTISGPGGIGKTRLAHALVLEVGEDFADGLVFVPLDPIGDPDLVVPTIARALGLRETQDEPLDALEAHLSDRQLLLVLDTFEHVADAAPALPELLTHCPRLKIVVTSRTRLRARGEQELPLGPLSEEAAVALFAERARAIAPDFELTTDRLAAVAEICAGLDGLPLAIELAAARVKVLTPEAMRERLESRLDLLAAGPRDVPERQRTLRDTIAWSIGLLGESEQALFARLAVFVGGFTLDAAEIVAGANLDPLASLVDESLVRRLDGRYRMLDTVREYALERLRGGGEEDEIAQAHASYFCDLAEEAQRLLSGPDQAAWRARLEAEHGNLRGALRYTLDRGHPDIALRLGAALWGFWLEHGYLSEGRGWLDEILARDSETPARAWALAGAGILAHYQGAYARGRELCDAGLAAARAGNDQRAAARALTGLALIERTLGNYDEAAGLFDEVQAIYESLGDRDGIARTLDRRGIFLAWFSGDPVGGTALLKESLAVFRELGDTAGVAFSKLDLALVEGNSGQAEKAAGVVRDSLAELQQLGDRRNVAKALYILGDLACISGDLDGAATHLEEAATLFAELGDRWFAALGLERAADVAFLANDPERATRLYGAAVASLESIGAPLPGLHRERHELNVDAVARALGETRFADVHADGRRLGFQAALELVRIDREPAAALEGTEGLTAREREVLELVATGMTDAEVAERLVVSLRTVHAHLRSVYRKLDVRSRSAATRFALEHGLVGDAA